jgi:hypothetical protein
VSILYFNLFDPLHNFLLSLYAEAPIDKRCEEIRNRKDVPQHKKSINNKPLVNIILNGEQLKPFLLKSGMRPTFPTPIQYSFRIPSQRNKTRARNKRDSNREERSQTISICR